METIRTDKLSKETGSKINIQKPVAFLCPTMKYQKAKVKISFIITPNTYIFTQREECRCKLNKEVKRPLCCNYERLIKDTEGDSKK